MDARQTFEQRAAAVDPAYEVPQVSDVPGREGYGWIAFEGLQNTRDLGGLVGLDGRRVKSGLLLRSGALGFGTEGDLARLRDEYRVRLVVDLRGDRELEELPDPMDKLPGARYLHANIIDEQAIGIVQDEESREIARARAANEKVDFDSFMPILYEHMLLEQAGVRGYRALFQELLALEEGAALWHCFVGRDRCGLASALVESVLGVPEEVMEADYLATNVYAPAEYTATGPAMLRSFHGARDAAVREYGGFTGYVEKALGITPGEIRDLQERYLEQ